jgi:hypothetical protein
VRCEDDVPRRLLDFVHNVLFFRAPRDIREASAKTLILRQKRRRPPHLLTVPGCPLV